MAEGETNWLFNGGCFRPHFGHWPSQIKFLKAALTPQTAVAVQRAAQDMLLHTWRIGRCAQLFSDMIALMRRLNSDMSNGLVITCIPCSR